MADFQATVENYQNITKKIRHLSEAISLMHWDLQTNAPKGAIQGRSEAIGGLSGEVLKLSVSEEMEKTLNELLKEEYFNQLSSAMKASVLEDKKEFDRYKKVPQDKFEAYNILTSKAQAVWQEAKGKNDFNTFQPYLEEIITYKRDLIELWGYEGHPYNTLLEEYEPGITVEKLDNIFNYLKENIIKLLQKINAYLNVLDDSMFQKPYNIEKQKEISLLILDKMGYDFNKGRMDESAHPFTIQINLNDVRVTTNFDEHSFNNAFFASIHEGGHGLYEQNVSEELKNTSVCTGTSMGIHESQSRFWENMVGRSLEFWLYFEDEIKKAFPENLENVSTEQIYRAINKIQPSLIRIFADEITYSLHIIVRYELEKELISGKIEVKDLPNLWNDKMEEYLGIRPEQDSEGVLQDVHWSAGLLGYFPSYSLGNIYAAQFVNKMKKDLPNYHDLIRQGEFKSILNWLKENIHCHGKTLKPTEIIEKVTGEAINPKYFIEYLEEKYSSVYNLPME